MKSFKVLTGLVVLSCVTVGAPHSRADDSSDRSMMVLGQSGLVAPQQALDAAIVVGGSLVVEGVVHGPAAAIGGNIDIRPGAVVENGVYAIGGSLRIDAAARVQGARMQVAPGDFGDVVTRLIAEPGERTDSRVWLGPILRLAQVMAVLVIALLLTVLAPRHVQAVRATLGEQPKQTALVGLLLILGFVPLCAILAVSLLGIPLIPIAVVGLLAALVLGVTGLAANLGSRLTSLVDKSDLGSAVALGMLLIAVATLVPVLGGVLWLLGSFYAAGAVILSRFGTHPPHPPSAPAQISQDRDRPERTDLATQGKMSP